MTNALQDPKPMLYIFDQDGLYAFKARYHGGNIRTQFSEEIYYQNNQNFILCRVITNSLHAPFYAKAIMDEFGNVIKNKLSGSELDIMDSLKKEYAVLLNQFSTGGVL